MSLVSSDAEGEQNEIRNLQEKLETAMRLVSNLSGQLTELKEQVLYPVSVLTQRPSCLKHRDIRSVSSVFNSKSFFSFYILYCRIIY